MIRLLVGVNLALVAAWLLTTIVGQATTELGRAWELADAAHYQRMAQAADADRDACTLKHRTLIKQIKHEGLWRRLGLNAQPWLEGK